MKTMKRILLSIQVLLVLSSYFTAAIGQTIDPILYADEQAVFFEKPDWWGDNIRTYIYHDDTGELYEVTGPWPGDAMESIGNKVYKYSFDGNISDKWRILFNDGPKNNQTPPITNDGNGGYDGFYVVNGGYYVWGKMDRVVSKTILPEKIEITNETVTYNGGGQSPTITIPIAPYVSFSTKYKAQGASESTYTTTKPTKAGTYDVLIDITESGYIGSKTGTFTINKATINEVLFPPQSKTYDGTTSVANIAKNNFTIPGIVQGDVVSVEKYNTALYDTKNAGDNKTIEITGIEYVGADVGNYNLPTSASNTSNKISKKPLTITADAGQTKVYDKNSNVPASYTYTHSGLVSGDSFSGELTRVPGENAGTYAIRIGSLAPLSGSDNYNITFNSNDFEITKKVLTITGAKAEDKIYDATDIATITDGTLNGVVGTDVVSFDVSATFNDKNVGTGKTVSTTFSLTGGTEVNNYSLIQPTGFTAKVTARELEIIGFSIKNRQPKAGDFSAEVESWGILQTIPTPDIGKVNIKKEVTAKFPEDDVAGQYEIELSPLELEGPEKDNYTLIQPTVEAYITNGVPIFEWPTSLETTYNGFDHPVIVEVTNTFKSAKIEYDYGDGIWVATAPRDAGNYRVRATSEDDTYVGDQIKILTINKKSIPAATFEAVTKEFDNTTNVSDQPTLILDGILSGDKVTASGDAAKYDNKNAGENKTVTINNIKLDGDDAANYTIPQTATNDKCSITKLDYGKVPLVFSFPAQSKVFDGTTSVKKNGVEEIPSITISGFLSGDSFTATATSATYDSPQAGTGKKVTLSGITYSHNAADNYELPTEISNLLGEITKLSLGDISEASATIADQTKVYDGTTDVKDGAGNVYIPTVSLSGLLTGFDDVTAAGSSAVYNDKNVGSNNKTVTVSGINYTGKDADNYTLPSTITNSTSSITPMDVEVVFDAQTKVYDGTTEVKDASGNIYIPTLSINGLIGADELTAIGKTATYDNKNVGENKEITIQGITYSGSGVNNYILPTTVENNKNSITPLDVENLGGFEVVFDAQTKVYDGTTEVKDASGNIYVPSLTVNGLIGADVVTAIGDTAYYDNKNVKENKVITIQGITYSGSGIDNYILPTTVENNKNSITPLDVENLGGFEVVFDAQTKVYDGTTEVKDASGNIYVPSLTVNGLIGADEVTAIGKTATYDNKNVGENKEITIQGITYSGSGVNNYILYTTV